MKAKYFSLFFLFIVLNAIGYGIIEANKNDRIEKALKTHIDHLQTTWHVLLYEQNSKVEDFMRLYVKPNLVLLTQLSEVSKQEQDSIRTQLYNQLKPVFQNLKPYGVTQIQFVLPNNHSFLRLYKPEHYGDDLTGIRKAVEYVNKTHRPTQGYEGGKVVHAYRYVKPLFDPKGRYLGLVEISFLTDYSQSYITQVSKLHSHFLVKKTALSKQIWEDTEFNAQFLESAENDDYLLKLTKQHNITNCITRNHKAFAAFKPQIKAKMAMNKAFAFYIPHRHYKGELGKTTLDDNNEIDVISLIPVKSIGTDGLAWLVSYSNDSYIGATLTESRIAKIAFFILLTTIFYFVTRLLQKGDKLLVTNSELRKTQKSLHKSQEIAHLGVWEFDLINNQLSWSDEIFNIFELDKSTFKPSYDAFIEQVYPDDRESVISAYENSLKTREKYRIVHRLLVNDGRIKWVEEQCETDFDSQGNALKSVGSVYDITQQKESEEKFKSVLTGASDGIHVLDENGNLILYNQAFCTMLGYEYHEMAKMNVVDWDMSAFKDQDHVQTMIANLLKAPHTFETKHKTKQGRVINAQLSVSSITIQGKEYLYASLRDITQQKTLQQALETSHAKYKSLIEDMGERFVIYSHTLEGIVLYMNDGIETVFGQKNESIVGTNFTESIQWTGDSIKNAIDSINYLTEHSGESDQIEMSFMHPDGKERFLSVTSHYQINSDNSITIDGIAEDITEKHVLLEQIKKQSVTDELTKLGNRKAFHMQLESLFAEHHRYKTPFCLLILDIDLFKEVNDNYGHLAGDKVLVALSQTMKQITRKSDFVYRFGGEEFIILLTHTRLENAAIFAEKLRTSVQQNIHVIEEQEITISIGVAEMAQQDDQDSLIKRADDNLYTAKETGRNRVVTGL